MGARPATPAQSRGALQIDDNPRFQARTWKAQRVGWALFAGMLLAAGAGVFGAGPISRTSAGSPAAGLRVEYERLARRAVPTEIIVHLGGGDPAAESVSLVLGGEYPGAAELQSSLPPPSGGGTRPEGAVLRFDAGGGSGARQLVLYVKFNRAGAVRGTIGLAGGPTLTLNHWIYP